MPNYAVTLGFLAAVLGCAVENNLGETATEGMTGGAEVTGSSESGSTSSLSMTSAGPSSSADETTASTSSSTSGTPEESSGGPDCLGEGGIVRWVQSGLDPVPNVDAQFRFALAGTCTVADMGGGGNEEPPASYEYVLECTLDGFVDGVEVTALGVQTLIELSSAVPPPVEIDDTMFLRVAAERQGLLPWNRWLILTTNTNGTFAIEAMNADRLHPQAGGTSPLIDEIGVLLGDDGWASGIDYGTTQGACPGKFDCEAQRYAIEVQTESDLAVLQVSDSVVLELAGGQPDVHVFVSEARDYPPDVCDDVPVAWFDIGAIAVG